MELFDGLNSINMTKQNIIRDDEGQIIREEEKSFNSFMTQRLLSYHQDTIFLAAFINSLGTKYHKLSNGMVYEFLLHTVPKGKRYAKFPKTPKSEILSVLQNHYGYSVDKAKDILRILSEDDIKSILGAFGGRVPGNKKT